MVALTLVMPLALAPYASPNSSHDTCPSPSDYNFYSRHNPKRFSWKLVFQQFVVRGCSTQWLSPLGAYESSTDTFLNFCNGYCYKFVSPSSLTEPTLIRCTFSVCFGCYQMTSRRRQRTSLVTRWWMSQRRAYSTWRWLCVCALLSEGATWTLEKRRWPSSKSARKKGSVMRHGVKWMLMRVIRTASGSPQMAEERRAEDDQPQPAPISLLSVCGLPETLQYSHPPTVWWSGAMTCWSWSKPCVISSTLYVRSDALISSKSVSCVFSSCTYIFVILLLQGTKAIICHWR